MRNRRPSAVVALHKAGRHEAVGDQHRVVAELSGGAADDGGGVERGAAGEHGDPAEHRLLGRRKEVVAPAHGVAHRPLASGEVDRAVA